MKKMYLNILTVLAISGLATSQALAVHPILRNNYGATVEFIELGLPAAEKESTNRPQYVNRLINKQETRLINFFNEYALSLRTIGGRGFYDVSTSLTRILAQIDNEKQYHPNETPVITISYNPLYWPLTLSWERR